MLYLASHRQCCDDDHDRKGNFKSDKHHHQRGLTERLGDEAPEDRCRIQVVNIENWHEDANKYHDKQGDNNPAPQSIFNRQPEIEIRYSIA